VATTPRGSNRTITHLEHIQNHLEREEEKSAPKTAKVEESNAPFCGGRDVVPIEELVHEPSLSRESSDDSDSSESGIES